MGVVVFLLALACVVCRGQDASCPVFVVQGNDGSTFSYDFSGLKVPNNDPSKFIKAKETGGASWTAYLNICGDASVVGCTTSTPVCQVDGSSSFSMGAPNWVFSPYYDPTKGPNSPIIPNGGVVVTAGGGSVCVFGPRKSILFFQCDPDVNQAPTEASIQESDPSDPNSTPTPCVYYWTGLKYSGFCPSPPSPQVSSSAIFPSTFTVSSLPSPHTQFHVFFSTTTFVGNSSVFKCKPSKQDCSLPYHECEGLVTNGTTIQMSPVNLTDVVISANGWRASWSAFEPSSPETQHKMRKTLPAVKATGSCQAGAGYVSSSNPALQWNFNPKSMQWALSKDRNVYLMINLSNQLDTCLTCNK